MRRHWIRGLVFVVAALFALQILPWSEAAKVFVSCSPLLSLLGALASRTSSAWILLGLPVVILGLFHSRWFCRHACPVGLATEAVGRLNKKSCRKFTRLPHLGRWLILLMIGGAAAGYPLFIWLDPLSLFNGFWSAWRLPFTATQLALAAGFPLVLLLSLIMPQAWCHRICPLGAWQDFLTLFHRAMLVRQAPAEGRSFRLEFGRRTFLGILAGGAAALMLRRTAAGKTPPIRPPGAQPEAEFTGLCARCGACIRACPYQILKPGTSLGNLAGFLAPAMEFSRAHCFEYCNDCTKVCPTGAIQRLALEAKRNRAIGLAEIDRDKCIAWHDRQYCMVCHEFCPYLAIDPVEHNGVNCPVVRPDMCRGCGACQVNCPVLPDKAIVVKGTPQHPARPLEEA